MQRTAPTSPVQTSATRCWNPGRSTWPDPAVPQQLHLDLTVPTIGALYEYRREAEKLGATLVLDRSEDEEEPLYVLADPAGHPFCIFLS